MDHCIENNVHGHCTHTNKKPAALKQGQRVRVGHLKINAVYGDVLISP